MAQRIWLVSLALSVGVGIGAAAQQRPISGKVLSATTATPIAGASVSVVGTPIGAVTNDRGEFSLSAPEGAVTLSVRGVGFKRQQLAVRADQANVNVTLEPDVFNLEAVVITGQATGVEQRNLANAVTTVNAELLNRAPTQTIESALQGKIPGAVIQMNSGAPGGGGQINLRGVTTINAGVDPLIVVDGLVIANDAIASNMNAVTAAAAGGNASNQDNSVNRIADLNPNDIQSSTRDHHTARSSGRATLQRHPALRDFRLVEHPRLPSLQWPRRSDGGFRTKRRKFLYLVGRRVPGLRQ